MKILSQNALLKNIKASVLAVPVFEDKVSLTEAKKVIGELYPTALASFESGDFKGKKRTTSIVYTNNKSCPRILLIGLGTKDSSSAESWRIAGAALAKRSNALRCQKIAALVLPTASGKNNESEIVSAVGEGILLGRYRYVKYLTDDTESPRTQITDVLIAHSAKNAAEIEKQLQKTAIVCEGVNHARDLANAPPNEIYAETLAQQCVALGKAAGFKTTVLDKTKITALKMGGLLAVNKGSKNPPFFVVMEYKGGPKTQAPIVLVGKGVTFDTGGISLKPGAGMSEMKIDMHGAATVIGTIYALAKTKAPVNVIALVPTTDNMPSGNAYLPGDIIRLMNGKSVEIDNTDAEGRLILGDALTFADRYKPRAVVDVATLTGACMIALGSVTTGMFGNNAGLLSQLKTASVATNEYVCEMPMYEEYEELIRSDVADVKNSGGRAAGAITAALFLQKFIGDYPWVHLDIAGTGILSKETDYAPRGGSGVAVRLLYSFATNSK